MKDCEILQKTGKDPLENFANIPQKFLFWNHVGWEFYSPASSVGRAWDL